MDVAVTPMSLEEPLLQEVEASVTTVFRDAFGINVQLVSSKKVESSQVYTGDVTGVVGLVQDSLEGNLIVSFGETVIFEVLSKVYGRKFTEIDSIVQEGAGELANMIFGQLKIRLNGRGHNLKMSLPSVVAGRRHRIQSAVSSSNLVALFGYDDKRFEVAVALQKFGKAG